MMHPLSDIARALSELQCLLAKLSTTPGRMPRSAWTWALWARALAEECSKDSTTAPRAMLATLQKAIIEDPEKLSALIPAINEKARELEKRVNKAWYRPDPMAEFLAPRKRRNEFQRRGRYAL